MAGGSTPATRGVLDMVDNLVGTINLASPSAAALTLGGAAAGDLSTLNFEFGSIFGTYATDNITLDASNTLALNPGGATVNITGIPGFGISGTARTSRLLITIPRAEAALSRSAPLPPACLITRSSTQARC